jgi:hypothetical protein
VNRALKEATVKRYYPHQSRTTKAGTIHLDWGDSMAVPFDKWSKQMGRGGEMDEIGAKLAELLVYPRLSRHGDTAWTLEPRLEALRL